MSTNKQSKLDADEEVVHMVFAVCASCGIAAIDDITLKFCDDCDLVKYCSVECQENHREKHEEDCKKRKAELHDKQLFSQPDISHWGECPICCLPLPIDPSKSTMMSCCCKLICKGCDYANQKREIEQGLRPRCPFCREPAPKSKEEGLKRVMTRIKKNNDPVAITEMGKRLDREGNYGKALEYYTKAAELGDVGAHSCVGTSYYNGNGVEKDMKKAVYHWEQAAIGGHPFARCFLGSLEILDKRPDRAMKHLIIAANLGEENSLKLIKDLFVKKVIGKEDYAAALRGYQTALNETKSAERKEGEAFYASCLEARSC